MTTFADLETLYLETKISYDELVQRVSLMLNPIAIAVDTTPIVFITHDVDNNVAVLCPKLCDVLPQFRFKTLRSLPVELWFRVAQKQTLTQACETVRGWKPSNESAILQTLNQTITPNPLYTPTIRRIQKRNILLHLCTPQHKRRRRFQNVLF